MRLLETSSIKLQEFHGEAIPEYAILSHTWGEYEVSFQALQQRNRPPYRAIILHGGVREEVVIEKALDQSDEDSLGWQKIKNCCALAARRGYKYLWIDTCCINKESSAELTEALNSMFRWYENANVCFAYLGDVPSPSGDLEVQDSTFRLSRWFTRAWTLQELLAPRVLEFFSADWQWIGSKETLREAISKQTGIPIPLKKWVSASVAAKMSWASQRSCMRVEDHAYSLLGLFQINMPLLYGEGLRAFQRLQLEILQKLTDETIFAWTSTTDSNRLLADSPKKFAEAGHIMEWEFNSSRSHYSMTNKGLHIETVLLEIPNHPSGIKILPLNCTSMSGRLPVDFAERLVPHALFVSGFRSEPNIFFRIDARSANISGFRWREIWQAHLKEANSGYQDSKSAIRRQTIYLTA